MIENYEDYICQFLLLILTLSIKTITLQESSATSKTDKIREGAKDVEEDIKKGIKELGKINNNYNNNENQNIQN